MTPPHDRFTPESRDDYLSRYHPRRGVDRSDYLTAEEEVAHEETERAMREDKFEDWNNQSTTQNNNTKTK